ncbi:helix-turn-helix domain-containing protein [Patescibacteria group bacterium]|nr:helix-turn-helix domain-containing protein [Patescibacteria group bacterium]
MLNTSLEPTRAYTPDQVAQMLQLSKNTVYELINRGEIVAKKIGKVYRIPAASIAFIFTGLDYDLYQMDQEDRKYLPQIEKTLNEVRSEIK